MAGSPLAQVGGIVRKVEVHVPHAAFVISLAYLCVHREREAAINGVGCGQFAVTAGADGGPGHHADLKGTSGSMFGAGTLGYFRRDAFGSAGGAKTAHTDGVAVLHEGGSLLRSDGTYGHFRFWG